MEVQFKVPGSITSLSVGGKEYTVEDGLITVANPSSEDYRLLQLDFGAMPAAPDEVEAVNDRKLVQQSKAEIVAQLAALGVQADARSSLPALEARLVKAKAAAAPAAAASA